jgi:uncharacterized protein (TIGR02757 family)
MVEELSHSELKEFLDSKYEEFNVPGFIADDPISIPHQFDKKEDIEIGGFLAATIAWGNRKSIINNANKLMQWMGYFPHEFLMNASEHELDSFSRFVHRTFNGTDTIFFLESLKNIYKNHHGLEAVFTEGYMQMQSLTSALDHFRNTFSTDNKECMEKDQVHWQQQQFEDWFLRLPNW